MTGKETVLDQRWLMQQMGEYLASVTGSMVDQELTWNWVEDNAGNTELAWWSQAVGLAAGAKVFIGATRSEAEQLGQQILASAGVEGSPEELLGTFHEVASQASASLVRAIGGHLHLDIPTGEAGELGAPGLPAMSGEIAFRDGTRRRVAIAFSSELVEKLKALQAAVLGPAEPSTDVAVNAPSRTMDLLLDVELPISISFGRAQLALRDVVKLSTGSIVELNRSVAEPVEIIVNNCVIARGEVVVVEGNYGVKINQIISRHERLRTLH